MAYVPIFFLNMVIIFLLIRWRGLLSVEGMGLAFLGLIVGSDFLTLILDMNDAFHWDDPFQLRMFPGVVHATGLLFFAIGLFVADRRPEPVKRDLSREERRLFVSASALMVFLGFSMWAIMMLSEGLSGISDYLLNMNRLQVEPRRLGIFLDRWSNVVLIGMGVLVAIYLRRRWAQVALACTMMVVAFFLTPSKGSILLAVTALYIAIKSLNEKLWRSLGKPWLLVSLGLIVFLAIGLKTQIRYVTGSLQGVSLSAAEIVRISSGVIRRRYSSSGLFEGYALSIHRLMEHPSFHTKGRVLTYIFTGSVPRFLWTNKPENPFRDIGFLFDPLGRYDPLTAQAPTLVGWAFLDFGFLSLIFCLFLGGILLGLIRRLTIRPKDSAFRFLWYLLFLSMFPWGLAETGFDGILNVAIISSVIVVAIYIFLQVSSIGGPAAYKPVVQSLPSPCPQEFRAEALGIPASPATKNQSRTTHSDLPKLP